MIPEVDQREAAMRACGSRHLGRALLLAGHVAAAGFEAGCGSGPKFGEVEGKVTFKGQPVTEGKVVFQHRGKEGHTGEADLDQEGKYVIKPPENPLPPGEYTVAITPLMYLDNADPRQAPGWEMKRAPNIP